MNLRHVLARLTRQRLAMFGLGLILCFVLIAALAQYVAPFSDHYMDPASQDGPPGVIDIGSHLVHWLGTDDLGRDIFSRLVYGVRVSLAVGLAANVIIVVIGTGIGLIAGFWGGLVDNLLMRFTDIMYSFPGLLFVLVLVATFGRSIAVILLALGWVNWAAIARIVRGQVMLTRQMDYVLCARSVGVTPAGIVVQHILPNILGPIIVLATFMIPGLITAEASLAFLGVGIDPTIPTLGTMINASLLVIYSHPAEVVFPVVVLALITLSFTFIGDGLRDALDLRLVS